MSRRVLQAVLVVAALASTVSAFATSKVSRSVIDGDISIGSGTATEKPVSVDAFRGSRLGDQTATSRRTVFSGVPIRSGRLHDNRGSEQTHRPVEIRLPSIDIVATVKPVGVDAENRFSVPEAETVGWYQHSASPGDRGASVLAAHVDFNGEQGAFFNLAKLLPGHRFEVELEDGSVLTFETTGNTQYDKTVLPAGELFRKTGDPVLQLITCGGQFDPIAHAYNANVVVTAVPVP